MKPESVIWQILKAAHMLANRNAISKQDGVGRTCAVRYVIDIVGIDSDEGGA